MEMQPARDKFSTFPGKCFRHVAADGHTRRCSNRVVRTGQFADSKGKLWTVDACAEHAVELVESTESASFAR